MISKHNLKIPAIVWCLAFSVSRTCSAFSTVIPVECFQKLPNICKNWCKSCHKSRNLIFIINITHKVTRLKLNLVQDRGWWLWIRLERDVRWARDVQGVYWNLFELYTQIVNKVLIFNTICSTGIRPWNIFRDWLLF